MSNPLSPTIFNAFEKAVKQFASQRALSYHQDGNCFWLTYQDIYDLSTSLSGYLHANHIRKGDSVAVILDNSRWWPISYLALMHSGAVAVPLYPHLEFDQLRSLLVHSGAKMIITSEALRQKIMQSIHDLPIPLCIIDTLDTSVHDRPVIQTIYATDLACLLYTSGTTAVPKGVMLTHENLLANVTSLQGLKILSRRDCIACLLPLYHAYPLMVNFLLPLLSGAKISVAETLDLGAMSACMNQTRVTVVVGVPRLFSFVADKIRSGVAGLPLVPRLLLQGALSVSFCVRKATGINCAKLLMHRAHSLFGNSLRFMVSGGARLDPQIARSFYYWGFTVLEGYGLTEAAPVLSYNKPGANVTGSVGRPVPGVQIKIHEPDASGAGEILARGRNITPGYYHDPELTFERIKNGWLHTRDIGYFDARGFLHIVGRNSELMVLSSGKKINPEEVEAYYCRSRYIKELCVFLPPAPAAGTPAGGDAIIALVLPDHEYLRRQGAVQVKDKIRFEIETLSLALPAYQRISKYIIIGEVLPRTVLGKIKRFEVIQNYAAYSDLIETKTQRAELAQDDMLLLEYEIVQEGLAYLSKRLKREVRLDDHLELDLGLDSLERISLFFEFQRIAGIEIDERLFFTVATVRDVLSKLKTAVADESKKYTTVNWTSLLNGQFEDEITGSVKLDLGILEKFINILFIGLVSFVGRLIFRMEVTGKENLPKDRPFLLCPNHVSYLDPPFVACALPFSLLFRTYFMGLRAILDSVFLAWSKKMLRLVPVDAAQNLTKTLKVCSYILRNSKNLCMFPEGGRSTDGRVKDFKRGVGILIHELQVPVVPVYIEGAWRAWPAGQRLPRPAKIRIHFGKPLAPETLSLGAKEGVDIYQAIADNLRQKVEELYDKQNRGY